MLTHFTPTAARTLALFIGFTGMILLSGCGAQNPMFAEEEGASEFDQVDSQIEDPNNTAHDPFAGLETSPQKPGVKTVQPNPTRAQSPNQGGTNGRDSGREDGSGDELNPLQGSVTIQGKPAVENSQANATGTQSPNQGGASGRDSGKEDGSGDN